MDRQEARLRCIEAAARNPVPHAQGYAAGVLETARLWEEYIFSNVGVPGKGTLGLPKK